MTSDSRLSDEASSTISQRLATLLADIHQLYIKNLGFHWNVEGPHFAPLHDLFQEEYTELANDLDEVAERIRALGQFAPSSVDQLSGLARLSGASSRLNAEQMLDSLTADYEALSGYLREDIGSAEELNDPGTADLLTSLLRQYEKRAWMLRSHRRGL